MNALLPWHRTQWQNLLERLRAGNMPHALLLTGPAGIGKNQFAALLAQTLLCETGVAQGQACGKCRSCLLYAADSHPDLRKVSPLETGKVIGVDQIRDIGQYLAHTSQYGGYKAVIITPAEQMNLNAANSLLKTLEEPSAWSLILLVTDRPGRLPATVLSRCQRIAFTSPNTQEGVQWLAGRIGPEPDPALLLALAEGAPLRAMELAQSNAFPERSQIMQELEKLAQGKGDLSAVAERFLKISAQQTLYWMYSWVADMIRILSCGGERYIVNRDMRELLVKHAQRVGLQGLHVYLQRVNEAQRLTGRQVNLQLLLESVLMAWEETFLSCDLAKRY
jgi:DNA polymerase-3 subunit delta'